MNVAVVHAKMEEYVLMESMLTFASVSLVSLERIVKWTLMIVIQHLVKVEVGLYMGIGHKFKESPSGLETSLKNTYLSMKSSQHVYIMIDFNLVPFSSNPNYSLAMNNKKKIHFDLQHKHDCIQT